LQENLQGAQIVPEGNIQVDAYREFLPFVRNTHLVVPEGNIQVDAYREFLPFVPYLAAER
jgi:hypothetical protein